MKTLIIQNCEPETMGLYEQYLSEHNIPFDIFHAYKNQEFPSLSRYDCFILGGTPISAYEIEKHEFLRKEYLFVKDLIDKELPCLGVCFGGQLLAMAAGAEVRKNPVMEIGGYEINLTDAGKKDRLFKNFPGIFPVFHWHGDTFDIPQGAELLATGENCRNQAFRYKNSVALQFHLEVTPSEAFAWADKYADEPAGIHKTVEQVINECKIREEEMKKLCYVLTDNFLFS